jgi:Rab-GTPase-TBC domain
MIKEDRASRWNSLLKIDKHSKCQFNVLSSEFKKDHPDQQQIHFDCQEIQKQLPMFEENELREYLELVLTFYCKAENLPYSTGMHEVMAPFFLLGFNGLKTVYVAFKLFVKRMMPRVFKDQSSITDIYKIFHHLLMYHEPLLCNALDGKMITPQIFGEKWFTTLFASSLNSSLLLAFWEFCLQEKNVTLPYFFALVFLAKIKEKILNKRNLSNQDLDLFQFYICELEELSDLFQEALSLQRHTPKSYLEVMERVISERSETGTEIRELIDSVTLTILPHEVQSPKTGMFVIDLRPFEEYTSGHYPSAFNFPRKLKLSTGID